MFQKLLNWIERALGGNTKPPNETKHDATKIEQLERKKTPKQVVVFRTVMFAILIGVFGMIIANFLEVDRMLVKSATTQEGLDYNAHLPPQSTSSSTSPFSNIENELEQRTKEILEKMIGVGKVSVLITVESTEEQIVELNKSESQSITQETDKNGGVREVTTKTNDDQVVFMEASGQQEPVISKTINPRIRGVLIVAEGAEDATVRKLIIQAVEKGLNVHQSKISVVPSKL